MAIATITSDWKELLEPEFDKPYFKELRRKVNNEYELYPCYPAPENIYRALNETPYEKTKCVLIGQDPYHGPGQAIGLSFAVRKGISLPPSLKNIYKELEDDLGIKPPSHGDLTKWAKEGVLLLNAVLTVREKSPNSHRGFGWEQFTDRIIELLNEKQEPVVFLLWGRNAQEKARLVTNKHHLIIQSAHPSPFSANRGFFGSRPFSRVNAFLKANGLEEIDWRIE